MISLLQFKKMWLVVVFLSIVAKLLGMNTSALMLAILAIIIGFQIVRRYWVIDRAYALVQGFVSFLIVCLSQI